MTTPLGITCHVVNPSDETLLGWACVTIPSAAKATLIDNGAGGIFGLFLQDGQPALIGADDGVTCELWLYNYWPSGLRSVALEGSALTTDAAYTNIPDPTGAFPVHSSVFDPSVLLPWAGVDGTFPAVVSDMIALDTSRSSKARQVFHMRGFSSGFWVDTEVSVFFNSDKVHFSGLFGWSSQQQPDYHILAPNMQVAFPLFTLRDRGTIHFDQAPGSDYPVLRYPTGRIQDGQAVPFSGWLDFDDPIESRVPNGSRCSLYGWATVDATGKDVWDGHAPLNLQEPDGYANGGLNAGWFTEQPLVRTSLPNGSSTYLPDHFTNMVLADGYNLPRIIRIGQTRGSTQTGDHNVFGFQFFEPRHSLDLKLAARNLRMASHQEAFRSWLRVNQDGTPFDGSSNPTVRFYNFLPWATGQGDDRLGKLPYQNPNNPDDFSLLTMGFTSQGQSHFDTSMQNLLAMRTRDGATLYMLERWLEELLRFHRWTETVPRAAARPIRVLCELSRVFPARAAEIETYLDTVVLPALDTFLHNEDNSRPIVFEGGTIQPWAPQSFTSSLQGLNWAPYHDGLGVSMLIAVGRTFGYGIGPARLWNRCWAIARSVLLDGWGRDPNATVLGVTRYVPYYAVRYLPGGTQATTDNSVNDVANRIATLTSDGNALQGHMLAIVLMNDMVAAAAHAELSVGEKARKDAIAAQYLAINTEQAKRYLHPLIKLADLT